MAATTMALIRSGLVTALQAGITAAQVSGYVLSNPTAPSFEIELAPDGVNYDMSMGRGFDEWFVTVRGLAGFTTDVGAQKTVDTWIAPSGTGSVKAAIESDRTLSGACDSLHVTSVVPRAFASASVPNATYVGAEWTVRILGRGV